MRWTWKELQETPVGVRTYVWDCIRRQRAAEQAAITRQARSSSHPQGSTVIEY